MQDNTKLGSGLFDVEDIAGTKAKIDHSLETLRAEFGNLEHPEADATEVTIRKVARLLELVDSYPALTPGARKCVLWELRARTLPLLEALVQSDMDVFIYDAETIFAGHREVTQKVDLRFENKDCLRRQIDRFLAAFDSKVDESTPLSSLRLHDGSRMEVMVPPQAVDGPIVIIQRVQMVNRSTDELTDDNARTKVIGNQKFNFAARAMLSENMLQVLKACVQGRVNIIVSGPKGAGKTTILNALCSYVTSAEQTCAIEEFPELNIPSHNLIRLQPSQPDWRGDRDIDQRLLVRKAFSTNPRRLILGDCTGGEAYDLLETASTNNVAWMMTLQANEPEDCLVRLEEKMTRAQPNLSPLVARHLIAQSRPLIVQVRQIEDGTHRVTEIAEVQGLNDGKRKSRWLIERNNCEQVKENDFFLTTLFHAERDGRGSMGFFKIKFVADNRIPSFVEKLEQEGIAFRMEWIKSPEILVKQTS
jgi:Flp pilus assembly CpaF family ATPase